MVMTPNKWWHQHSMNLYIPLYISLFRLYSFHSSTFSPSIADLQKQIEEDLLQCLNLPSTFAEPGKDEKEVNELRSEIAAKQEQHLGLCTEKVLLARQAYDLVSVARLPNHHNNFDQRHLTRSPYCCIPVSNSGMTGCVMDED